MSDHDPLCPELKYGVNADLDWPSECECDLIKLVRADQATKSYREGYNDCAKAQQRTLIEYGGRPSKPGLCGRPCHFCFVGDRNPCTNQPGHEGSCDCNGVEKS